MSHLLYLHAVDWPSYESVFVRPKQATIDVVVAAVNVKHLQKWVLPELTAEKVADFAPCVLGKGAVDRAELSADDQKLFDFLVEAAFRTKKAGIKLKPISPNGMGSFFFDEFAGAFEGKKGKALLATLRSERFLLTPAEVERASALLASLDAGDDDDGVFASELVEPFAAAAKKKQGIRGEWC